MTAAQSRAVLSHRCGGTPARTRPVTASRIQCSTRSARCPRTVSVEPSIDGDLPPPRTRGQPRPVASPDQPPFVRTCGRWPGSAGVTAHPLRERDVACQQLLGIAAAPQPKYLGCACSVDVEKTDRDVDAGCRGRGEHLARRHRIACEQEVDVRRASSRPARATAHSAIRWRHAMSGTAGTDPRCLQLDAFDHRCEVGLDGTSSRGLAGAARTGEQGAARVHPHRRRQPVFRRPPSQGP